MRRGLARRLASAAVAFGTAVSLSVLTLATPAAAAGTTWYVDANSGGAAADCGQSAGAGACASIDLALAQAQDGDTIQIAAGTYDSDTALPAITTSVTLQGESTDGVIIVAGNPQIAASGAPTLDITGGADVRLADLTIRARRQPTGTETRTAVVNISGATVTMDHVRVDEAANGIDDVSLVGVNIGDGSTVRITDSTLTDHQTDIRSRGGSSLTLTRSTVTGYAGGGIVNGSDTGDTTSLTLTDTTVSGPGPIGTGVGIVATGGTATLTNTDVSGNFMGLSVFGGTVTVTDGSIHDNYWVGVAVTGDPTVTFDGTHITGNGVMRTDTTIGSTAGIFMQGGTVSGTGLDLSDNPNGAVALAGTLSISASTITGSLPSAGPSPLGFGVWGDGGSLQIGDQLAPRPMITVTDTTISGNNIGIGLTNADGRVSRSTVAANSTMAVFTGAGGQYPDPSVLTMTNSTVSGAGAGISGLPTAGLGLAGQVAVTLGGTVLDTTGTPACFINTTGSETSTLADGGYNVASDSSCDFTQTTSVVGDPQLGPLVDNGGPGPTMMPLAGSPAIDLIPVGAVLSAAGQPGDTGPSGPGLRGAVRALAAPGDGSLCVSGSTDQAGTTLPQGDACDAGATEFVAPPLVIDTTSLPGGMVGVDYGTATVQGEGGTGGPYTWSITAGALPHGLKLDASTGKITGTPDGDPGTATFTVQLADGVSDPVTRQLSIVVAAPPVTTVTTTATATVTVTAPVTRTVTDTSTATATGPAQTTGTVTVTETVTRTVTVTPTPSDTSASSSASSTAPSSSAPSVSDTSSGAGDLTVTVPASSGAGNTGGTGPTEPSGGELASTGVNAAPGLVLGLAALLLGLGLVLAASRRRGAHQH
jgi:hypothetical protein